MRPLNIIMLCIFTLPCVAFSENIEETLYAYLDRIEDERLDKIFVRHEDPERALRVFRDTYYKWAFEDIDLTEDGLRNLWKRILKIDVPENDTEQQEFVPFSDDPKIRQDLNDFYRYKRVLHSLAFAGVEVFDYLPEEGLPPMHARLLVVGFPLEKTLDHEANEYLFEYIRTIIFGNYDGSDKSFAVNGIGTAFVTFNLELPGAKREIFEWSKTLVESNSLDDFTESVLLKELVALDGLNESWVGDFIEQRLKFRRFSPGTTAVLLKTAQPLYTPHKFSHILGVLGNESVRVREKILDFYVDGDPEKGIVKAEF